MGLFILHIETYNSLVKFLIKNNTVVLLYKQATELYQNIQFLFIFFNLSLCKAFSMTSTSTCIYFLLTLAYSWTANDVTKVS